MQRPTPIGTAIRAVCCAGVIALGAACSDQSPRVASQCTGHVALQVGRGVRPTINWQPACGVGIVTVASDSSPADELPVWGASSFGADIMPPVQYGVKPAGAQEAFMSIGGDSLVVGARYIVTVGPPLRGIVTDSLVFTAQADAP